MVTGGNDIRDKEQDQKKQMLQSIKYDIENFRHSNKKDVRRAIHKQLMQNMREEEYLRTLKML